MTSTRFLEVVRSERPARTPHVVLFDFDGTISLIREGWQALLLEMEMKLLEETPKGREMTRDELEKIVSRQIELQIGKQTIFQCTALVERMVEFGAEPETAEVYLAEYDRRLQERVVPRHENLQGGGDREKLLVPGVIGLLELLRKRGIRLYLASGTEDGALKKDAALLGVTDYFDGGIYGGQADPSLFSKAMIVDRILRENDLHGEQLTGFGDGHTETVDVRAVGGFTVGVASNEQDRSGVDLWKRRQLVDAGADWIIPDYSDLDTLETRLFGA